MAYYDALKALWPSLTGTTDQKLAQANALTVAGPTVVVPVSSIMSYLALAGKLAALAAYAKSPPQTQAGIAAAQLFALPSVGVQIIEMTRPPVYAAVQGWLSALVGDANSGITSTDMAALMALATPQIPWWQANGYSGPFTSPDLQNAGGLT